MLFATMKKLAEELCLKNNLAIISEAITAITFSPLICRSQNYDSLLDWHLLSVG
jgi:hypothetical protein